MDHNLGLPREELRRLVDQAVRARFATEGGLCDCGCATPTRGTRFLPRHDGHLKAQLVGKLNTPLSVEERRSVEAELASRRNWLPTEILRPVASHSQEAAPAR